MPTSTAAAATIHTTLALIDQFSTSLSSPSGEASGASNPSPLPLLATSGNALKAQTTKLSLLAINSPFTPSAVSTILAAVNDSILPSLATATLLVDPQKYTKTLNAEATTLTKLTLRDFKTLVEAILERDGSTTDLQDEEKKTVTEATGRIWDDCDNLVTLAKNDIAGLVVKRAQQYQALIRDAIKELEEWDPEVDDEDEFFGDLQTEEETPNDSDEVDNKDLHAQKQHALKVFQRIPQCIHVIIKNRLQKPFPPSLSRPQSSNLDRLVHSLETTSEAVDETAGSLYERDLFSAKTYVDKAKATTIDAVECVLRPWDDSGGGGGDELEETKEDRYMKRAREWIQNAGVENPTTSTAKS